MASRIVNNGETLTTAVSLNGNEDLLVMPTGGVATLGFSAVTTTAGNNSISLAGTLMSNITTVQLNGGTANLSITRTGQVLSSGYLAIEGSASSVIISNYGFIDGQIELGFNAGSIFYNGGTVNGAVRLGNGPNTFFHHGGTITENVSGGTGSDYFVLVSAPVGTASVRYYGGLGVDELNASQFNAAIWVDLDWDGGASVWTRDDRSLASGAWREIAWLEFFDNIRGSNYSDYLAGSATENTFRYSLGFDTINGKGGSDTYSSPDSFDPALWVDLASADVEVWTVDGSNVVSGTWRAVADLTSVENFLGTFKSDYFAGDGGANRFITQGFFTNNLDRADGRGGTDTLDYSRTPYGVWVHLDVAGADAYTKSTANVNVAGGTWNALTDATNFEDIYGSAYGDDLMGNTGSNWIIAGGGDDLITYTGGAIDWLYGDAGTDTVSFSPLAFGVWVDLTYAGVEAWRNGANTMLVDLLDIENITGTAYNDYIAGSTAANRLTGGAGNDTLIGGLGIDALEGGANNDTFAYRALGEVSGPFVNNGGGVFLPTAFDTILDFQTGLDKIDLRGIPDANLVTPGNQSFTWSNSGAAGTVFWGAVPNGGGLVGLLFSVDNVAGADYFLYSPNIIVAGDVLLV